MRSPRMPDGNAAAQNPYIGVRGIRQNRTHRCRILADGRLFGVAFTAWTGASRGRSILWTGGLMSIGRTMTLLVITVVAAGCQRGERREPADTGAATRAVTESPGALATRREAQEALERARLAFERKDSRAADGNRERLRAAIPADSPLATNIAGSIDEARRLGNLPAAPAQAETSPPRAASGAAVSGAAVSGAAVSGEVRLAPELATRLAPGDTVFVTARAAQGPRIPLAVQRLQGKELPASFRLDDALAMAPNMKLSGFAEVVISARVSRSGQALPQSGDLESAPVPVKSGASGVILTIDRVVP